MENNPLKEGTREAVHPPLEENEVIISILFKKSRFPTMEQVVLWMKAHGYPEYVHHEFKTAWVIHTIEGVDYRKERTVLLDEGVMALIALQEF